jgi:hypothetical protein
LKRSLGYGFFDSVEQLRRRQGTAFSQDRQNSLSSTAKFGGNATTAGTLLCSNRGAKTDREPSGMFDKRRCLDSVSPAFIDNAVRAAPPDLDGASTVKRFRDQRVSKL